MAYGLIAPEIARNEAKTCSDSACHRTRDRVSGYCKMHTQARYLYGHPRGRRLAPREYAPEAREAAAFIREHQDHPAINAALGWLSEWLQGAWMGNTTMPAVKDMQRLYGHNVSTLSVLTEVVAVWLYSVRSPNSLPDDMRLTYALSLAVLALAPQETRPSLRNPEKTNQKRYSAAARREIGEHLRKHLAPLIVNMSNTIRQHEEQAKVQHAALRTQFM